MTRLVDEEVDLPAVPRHNPRPARAETHTQDPKLGTPSLWPHWQQTAPETRVNQEEEHWTVSPLGPSLGLSRLYRQQSIYSFIHSRVCAGRRGSSSKPDKTPHLATVTFQWKGTDEKQNKQAGHVGRRRTAGLDSGGWVAAVAITAAGKPQACGGGRRLFWAWGPTQGKEGHLAPMPLPQAQNQ